MPCVRFNISWDREDLHKLIAASPAGKLKQSMRFIEAQVAADMGIPFDMTWYGIPRITREQLIAARMAARWIDSIAIQETKQ